MRFYQLETKQKVKVPESEEQSTVVMPFWFGTERDAIVERNKLHQSGKTVGLKREQMIYPVDVPTDKAGLLKFLQNNVTKPVIL